MKAGRTQATVAPHTDGIIPFLSGLYDYSWVVGFVAAFVLYLVLTPKKENVSV